MSINTTTERPGTRTGQLAVPWGTVVSLAVVMAYADGFWMLSLRGAVGAIERTDRPFASWLVESTLTLPVFVFAVLGALTLALHLFGPALLTWRTVLAAALLVVAAGTVVGIAEIAASSALDYALQSGQLQSMDSMRDLCTAGDCLTQQQDASRLLQVRAVGYGSGILLITNLILVGWVIALWGGRLKVTTRRPKPASSASDDGSPAAAQGESLLVDDLRLSLVAGLLASAAIYAVVVPNALSRWAEGAALFVVVVAAELAVWMRRPATSEHVRWLAHVAVIAVAALGFAGSSLGWFDGFTGAGNPADTMTTEVQ